MEFSKDGTTPIAFPAWVKVTKCRTRTNRVVWPRGTVAIPGAANDIHGATSVFIESWVE